jgi:hypothetical protein
VSTTTATEHDNVGPPRFLIEGFLTRASHHGSWYFCLPKKTLAALISVPVQRNPTSLVTVRGASKRLRKPRSLAAEEFQRFAAEKGERKTDAMVRLPNEETLAVSTEPDVD